MLDKEYNGIVEFEVGGCHCSQLGVIDGEDSNSRAAIHKMWAVGDPFEWESMHSILYGGRGGRELWANLQHTHRHTELSRVIETMAQYACTILFDINNSKNLFWNIRFIIITIQTLTEHSKYINIILDSL